ncbi:type VII secretion integral membrane protein EccD [Corynebacterium breve]|uniref:Type VII secretion integral membrane protein EccD n=1 Tax=Corynebacterium breve TaxID=3049799 RepID=A0ABY8VKP1_9CORY|nr:type VII secretion integral membrane protein EccD [Corynebacterium breve]WIM68135.1 type VII secretion integral membrane protein EccD [Corynebacterium breve]
MTSATHHVVRLTVRLDVGAHHSHADLTIPSSSTFGEALPEILGLIEAPVITQPWEFATAAGLVYPLDVPTHNLALRNGQVLVLRPRVEQAAPVVRDAAESLSAQADAHDQVGSVERATSVLGIFILTLLFSHVMKLPAAITLGAIIALLLSAFVQSQLISIYAIMGAGTAIALWVMGANPDASSVALGIIVGSVASCILLIGAGYVSRIGIRGLACGATAALVLIGGSVGVWLPSDTAPAGCAILIALGIVMAAPGIATRVVGLHIPRVPTAGEEMPDADDHQLDVDSRAKVAKLVSDGIPVGLAVGLLPAFWLLGFQGGEWAWALCSCFAAALAVHASRHHYPIPRISLVAIVMTALLTGVIALIRVDAHPGFLVAAGIIVLIAVSAPLWSHVVSEFEPTTIVWFERAEQVAIIAVIPLAIHLAGIFELIRGL